MSEKEKIYQIIASHFPYDTIENVRLPSKLGCDNIIYLIKFCSDTIIIFRQPLKIDSSKTSSEFKLNANDDSMPYFPMHRLGHQAWALELLKNERLSPKLLALNPEKNYLIESYISGQDFNEFSPEICKELGGFLHMLHSIKMKQFGYMSEQPGVGVYSSWLKMFETAFNNLNENQYPLEEIYLSMIPYLTEFSNPVLLHGDISSENMRVLNGHLNGVIDYADCLCGDGLYDIGRLLLLAKAEWKYVDAIAQGYKLSSSEKSWTKSEKQCIRFYACYFAMWLESDNDVVEKLLMSIPD
ncbi:unnamed protein product [Rotaria sp. Silwood2]|nr:unnamed protein product [Rotaria sp. Silwood2]CAF3002598.1 unnamed protein product [Rotaria sp. Silwood2]CAF3290581.1 unnamed protein product [Rotaria sp. Silwood2]CAF3363467.1 unnamed protein product [Rotaria sp. Silwood2]CAF3978957.1 unnamed protein product [Rotaria sp. Silwood2]